MDNRWLRSTPAHEAPGFKLEGRLRNMVYTNGEHYDELYFGVTRAEWDQGESAT